MRTCTDCGETKPLSGFTPIRGTNGHYGRCKACRAERARIKRMLAISEQPPKLIRTPKPPLPARGSKPPTLRQSRPVWPAGMRQCTTCDLVKPLDAFVRIRACKEGFYGSCKQCRADRARARYQNDPEYRAAEIARVMRGRQRRRTAQAVA